MVVLGGCGDDVRRTEVARVPSPDAVLDAVVVETDGGATTPFGYQVRVLPRGCAAEGPPALRVVGARRNAGGASGVTVAWSGPRELVVRYLDAQFTDPAAPSVVTGPPAGGPVTIRLCPGAADPGAPAGSMADAGPAPAPAASC